MCPSSSWHHKSDQRLGKYTEWMMVVSKSSTFMMTWMTEKGRTESSLDQCRRKGTNKYTIRRSEVKGGRDSIKALHFSGDPIPVKKFIIVSSKFSTMRHPQRTMRRWWWWRCLKEIICTQERENIADKNWWVFAGLQYFRKDIHILMSLTWQLHRCLAHFAHFTHFTHSLVFRWQFEEMNRISFNSI